MAETRMEIDGFRVSVDTQLDEPSSDAPTRLVPAEWTAPTSEDDARANLDDLNEAEEEAEELLRVLAAAVRIIKDQHYEILLRQGVCRRLLMKPVTPSVSTKKGPGRPKKTVTADPVPATAPEALPIAAARNHHP